MGFEKLASLRWTKVLARGGGTRSRATSLLDAQGTAFNDLTLKAFLGRIGLLSSDHLDEAKATGLLGMGIKHDLALLNLTILFEQASDFSLRETWVNAGDEQVRAWIDSTITLGRWAAIILGSAEAR